MELFNKKIGVLVGIILIGIIATSSLYAVGRYSKGGFVLSRAQIKGSNGKPIFVEVNANGDEVREIGETIGELDGAYVVSGSSYKESLDTYINFRLNNLSLVNGAVPLRTIGDNGARSEYQSYCRQLPAISLPASSPDAPPTTHSVPCPQVDSDVKSVLIRGPTTINSAETLGTDGPIIYKSDLDLGSIAQGTSSIHSNVNSVLLSKTGKFLTSSRNTITFKVAYFKPDENGDQPAIWELAPFIDRDRILRPLPGTPVYYLGGTQSSGLVDSEFKYVVPYILPGCQCSATEYEGTLSAEIPYTTFNPKLNRDFGTYTVARRVEDQCHDFSTCPPGSSLAAVSAQTSALAISAGFATRNSRTDLEVDAMVLTGFGTLRNVNSEEIGVGDTIYSSARGDHPSAENYPYDVDKDGRVDRVIHHTDGYSYFYTNSRLPERNDQEAPVNFDLKKRTDNLPDFNDRGLLETISSSDLKRTDFYVYRVSTGDLLFERLGLEDDEIIRIEGAENSTAGFVYSFLMRGPSFEASRSSQYFSQWNSGAVVPSATYNASRTNDILPGELVEIIAINRSTGYMDSVKVPLITGADGPNSISVPVNELRLKPPNIKVSATRRTRSDLGLSSEEINDYLIGSEGSGLVSDDFIAISTEWYTDSGAPLPDSVPGYGAMLAKIVDNGLFGEDQLASDRACGSDVSNVTIRPGRNLLLVKLNDSCDLSKEHYYLYVCGHNPSSPIRLQCFDFSDTGRPSHYVPVKTPIYDEFSTLQATNANNEEGSITTFTDADPIYRWQYRPEMQFSVFDYTLNNLRLSSSSSGELIDLSGQDPNALLEGLDLDDLVIDVLYDLETELFDPLEGFSSPRELVLNVNGTEQVATIQENGQVTFNNLGFIEQLSTSDMLLITLYQNNDDPNVLWEYELAVDLDIDSDNTNGVIFPPDRNSREDSIENKVNNSEEMITYPGKVLTVSRDDANQDGRPDFADFMESNEFVQMIFELPNELSVEGAEVRFNYSASSPEALLEEPIENAAPGTPQVRYRPAPGHLRVWTINGNEERTISTLDQGGHYVPSDMKLPVSLFGVTQENREVVLYVEAIDESEAVAELDIEMEYFVSQ